MDSKLAEISKENMDILLVQYNSILSNLKNSMENVDETIMANLEKLLKEANDKFESGQKKVSIFDLNNQNTDDLVSFNELKKKEKVIDELNDRIVRYNDLIRKKKSRSLPFIIELKNTKAQLDK